jgi:hypothetical protein
MATGSRNRVLAIALATVAMAGAGVAAVVVSGDAQPDPGPQKLAVGIFTPSIEFSTSQQRLQYVQGLAKAIEGQTGIKTEAQSFASLGALKSAKVDFAIVDGQCYATNLGWKLLANAQVGGASTRAWALYSSVGGDLEGLRGKKLAYVQTGCNDKAFVDNAMLESQVADTFFSARVGKPDVTAAVAEVASYKGAQGVFAPVGSQKGLTKVFDTGAVPNPAFVQLGNVPSSISDKVAAAVTGYGGGGAIASWTSASKSPYQTFAGRMQKIVMRSQFANPEPVRIDSKDVLVEPATADDPAETDVLQHFNRPPDRLE